MTKLGEVRRELRELAQRLGAEVPEREIDDLAHYVTGKLGLLNTV